MKLASLAPRTTRGLLCLLAVLTVCLALAGGATAYYWKWNTAYPQRLFGEAELALAKGDAAQVTKDLELLEPFDDFAPHRHYLRGALYLQKSRFKEALPEFRYSQFHPRLELPSLIHTGEALYKLGRAPEAVDHWRRALKLNPNAINAHRWLGAYYFDVGAMDNAKLHLEKVASLDPHDGRPHRLLGLIERDYQLYGEAVASYRESLRRDSRQPDHYTILEELAQCEVKLHHYQEALEVLAQCHASVRATTLAAECHFSLGAVDLADRLTAKALREDPHDMNTLELRGQILLQQGKLKLATKVLEAATRQDPKDYIVQLQLAQAYQRLGRTKEAIKYSQQGAELRDKWAAFADLHEQAIAHPRNAEVRYKMALMALELNRSDLAEEWFRATLRLNPQYQDAQQRLFKLRSAEPAKLAH